MRQSKTVDAQSTRFVWDHATGGVALLLVDGGDRYVYGPGGTAVEKIGSDGTVSWLHQDRLGSTRTLTDTAGAVVGAYDYDVYGAVTAHNGRSTPLQWAGQYSDTETGLQYLRARYYDPVSAQFLSRDPIETLTRQAYQYGAGNPVNNTDPSGLCFGFLAGLDTLGCIGVAAAVTAVGAGIAWIASSDEYQQAAQDCTDWFGSLFTTDIPPKPSTVTAVYPQRTKQPKPTLQEASTAICAAGL